MISAPAFRNALYSDIKKTFLYYSVCFVVISMSFYSVFNERVLNAKMNIQN